MLSGLTSQRETDGTKMKSSKGVVLFFLALIFKVAVAETYTKTFLIELEIENSAYSNVTTILGPSTQINMTKAIITEINSTTDCTLNVTQKNCLCITGYTWSEDICKKHGCCKSEKCLLKAEETAVCLSEKRVSISGFIIMEGFDWPTLSEEITKQDPNNRPLTQEIKNKLIERYSTLPYFDSLIINSFSKGSVNVDYTVQLLGPVSLNQLEKLTTSLNKSTMVTTGLIDIKVPENQPIDIGSRANINCTPPENLGEVKWFLTDDNNKTTPIARGLEADIKTTNMINILELKSISKSWKGTFKCVYTKNSIDHTASKELDIALLPEIQAWSDPQFPDCRTERTVVCTVKCDIPYSTENYTVKWTTDKRTSLIKLNPENQSDSISYKAKVDVCTNSDETVNVYCTFTNNRSKSNSNITQKVEIPIIKSNSQFCDKDDVWPITKSNYIAKLPCENSGVGLKMRACNGTNWKKEISSCVNKNLHVIQTDVEELNKGIGFINETAKILFERIKESTTIETFNSFANINTSVNIFNVMNNVAKRQSNQWNDTVIPDFVNSISNALNYTEAWKNPVTDNTNISVKYLQTIEEMVSNSNLSSDKAYSYKNAELQLCNGSCNAFNATVNVDNGVVVFGFRNLHEILPQPESQAEATSETTILSVTNVNNTNLTKGVIKLMFDYSKGRLPNHNMYCVFWDVNQSKWSQEGCEWGGADNAELCTCEHNSAFTILMSKTEETLPYMEELTYAGLGISVVSLVICLIIEILIWDTVVKSDISNFRHVAIFNICLCLLLADCAFLASAEPEKVRNWCFILTIVKHFFFLTVFFWMLCLSFVILHQIIFVFDHLRKKVFMGLSITLGYVCPILCVAITLITFKNGAVNEYYSEKTCWLIYKGTFKGSIFAFVLPVGTIVFINLFTLAVVIMKIVTPTVSEAKARDEKDVAKSMIKTIVFLSPVLGITWLLGFFVIDIDLTKKTLAYIVNYTFTILNSLQGFFILLTNCLGEKKVRDALRKRFKGSKQSAHSKSESSTKMTSSVKKK